MLNVIVVSLFNRQVSIICLAILLHVSDTICRNKCYLTWRYKDSHGFRRISHEILANQFAATTIDSGAVSLVSGIRY